MKITLWDMMGRRINDMSGNIEKSVSHKITESNIFALQADESTVSGGKAQLTQDEKKIEEQRLPFEEVEETTETI
jgi:GMP synthase-like glutamine amidotransferase